MRGQSHGFKAEHFFDIITGKMTRKTKLTTRKRHSQKTKAHEDTTTDEKPQFIVSFHISQFQRDYGIPVSAAIQNLNTHSKVLCYWNEIIAEHTNVKSSGIGAALLEDITRLYFTIRGFVSATSFMKVYKDVSRKAGKGFTKIDCPSQLFTVL